MWNRTLTIDILSEHRLWDSICSLVNDVEEKNCPGSEDCFLLLAVCFCFDVFENVIWSNLEVNIADFLRLGKIWLTMDNKQTRIWDKIVNLCCRIGCRKPRNEHNNFLSISYNVLVCVQGIHCAALTITQCWFIFKFVILYYSWSKRFSTVALQSVTELCGNRKICLLKAPKPAIIYL